MKRLRTRILALGLGALLATSIHGLTNGPSMPEYNDFEPVDATDMVNLYTGDFSYNIPLMTVPGPGLSFPIVLNYHAGISPKQEASWVGLGWNLQAGSITRQVNQIPDDFKGDSLTEEIKSERLHGWHASISYNMVTVGISHDNSNGYGGMVGVGVRLGEMAKLSVDMGFNGVYEGVGVSLGIGVAQEAGGVAAGAGASIGYDVGSGWSASIGGSVGMVGANGTQGTLASAGVSLSSRGVGGGANAIGIPTGTSAINGSLQTKSSSFFIPIPTPIGYFQLNWGDWSARIYNLEENRYYGFLYQGKGTSEMDCAAGNCSGWSGNSKGNKKQEFSGIGNPYGAETNLDLNNAANARLMATTQDLYAVATQGLSGTFEPSREEDGDYLNILESTSKFDCDGNPLFFWECEREHANRTKELEATRDMLNDRGAASDIYWRFTGDLGGAEYTNPNVRNTGADAGVRSKKIQAVYTSSTGRARLRGFIITKSDGVVYEYRLPVWNYWEVKEGIANPTTAEPNPLAHTRTTQIMHTPYAYAWLLTAIKSTDYVDLNGNNRADRGDLGGWVSFAYGDGTTAGSSIRYNWRAPYADESIPETNANIPKLFGPSTFGEIADGELRYHVDRSAVSGMKEFYYLQTITTPTHSAHFQMENREDGLPYGASRFVRLQGLDDLFEHTITHASGADHSVLNLRIDGTVETMPDNPGEYKDGETMDVQIHYAEHYQVQVNQQWVDRVEIRTLTSTSEIGSSANYHLPVAHGHFQEHKLIAVYLRNNTGTNTRMKRLTKILLRKDNDSFENPIISSAAFDYSYDLCPNTPNSGVSANHGKLTLESVRVGAGENGPWLPPYRFAYENKTLAFQSGAWEQFEKNQWDRWGYVNHSAADAFHPTNPAQVAAWSMNQVTLPSGGKIQVEYEPDDFRFVQDKERAISSAYGNGDPVVLIPIHQGENRHRFPLHTSPENIPIDLTEANSALAGLTFQGYFVEFYAELTASAHPIGLVIPQGQSFIIEPFSPTSPTYHTYPFTTPQDELNFTFMVDWDGRTFDNSKHVLYRYRIWGLVAPPSDGEFQALDLLGGGIRVKKLRLVEPFSGKVNEASYGYTTFGVNPTTGNSEPISSGVTPSLPPTYGNYNDSPYPINQGFEQYLGSAGVGYSQVKLEFTGRGFGTEYLFATSRQYPIRFGNPAALTSGITPAPVASLFRIPIEDYSSLWGGLMRKVDFDDVAPVRDQFTDYAYNFAKDDLFRNPLYLMFEGRLTAPNGTPLSGAIVACSGTSGTNCTPPAVMADGNFFLKVINTNAAPTFRLMYQAAAQGPLQEIYRVVPEGSQFRLTPRGYTGTPILLSRRVALKMCDRQIALNLASGSESATMNVNEAECVEELVDLERTAAGAPEMNVSSTYASDAEHFGVQQRVFSHRYFWKNCTVGSCAPSQIAATQIVHKKFSAYPARTLVIQDNVPVATYSHYPDFRTGGMLNTVKRNSDGDYFIEHTEPAHRHYAGMESDNMLDQVFAVTNYHYPATASFPNRLPPGEIPASQATSSLVTKWQDYGTGVYRKAEELRWRDKKDFLSVPFNAPSPTMATANWVSSGKNIAYDGFGNRLQFEAPNGQNTSFLYGHQKALMTAHVQNAALGDAFYQSFESPRDLLGLFSENFDEEEIELMLKPTNSRTGRKSILIRNISFGNGQCLSIGNLRANTEFEASAWYYDENSANSTTNPTKPGLSLKGTGCTESLTEAAGVGSKKWSRIKVAFTCANAAVNAKVCLYSSKGASNSSTIHFDELRVAPKAAFTTTFAYDAKGRMISSADPNEVATHYEYDAFGNLSGIRNDDGVLLSEQAKKFGAN